MRKTYALTLLLFLLILAVSKAQTSTILTDSLPGKSHGLQILMKNLPKRDHTVLTSVEQATITTYLNTLGTRIRSFSFINGQLFVDPQSDLHVFDLLEGIKERGVSLMYISGNKMSFANDDLKIETWSIK
jgi:hypothetical protein